MITIRCTKEALAESIYRLVSDEVREMSALDLMVLRNAYKNETIYPSLPVKVQAIMIRLAGEVISEFEE